MKCSSISKYNSDQIKERNHRENTCEKIRPKNYEYMYSIDIFVSIINNAYEHHAATAKKVQIIRMVVVAQKETLCTQKQSIWT